MSKEHIKHLSRFCSATATATLGVSRSAIQRFQQAIAFAIPCRGTMSPYPTVVSVAKLKNTSSGGRISLTDSTASRNEPGETSSLRNAQGLRMLLGAFRGETLLERIVGYSD